MAIIRNLASMMLKGKIGDTTYYVAESRQLARQALNNSNYGETASRTDVQQTRRVKWANLVNFYSANKGWMKKAYENLAPGVSVFNRFMQLNINNANIPLTKAEAQAKAWVSASYRVTQGSLLTVPVTTFDSTDKISLGDSFGLDGSALPGETMTVGELSQGLIRGKYGFAEGDAIVFVMFIGTTAEPNSQYIIPASYRYVEIVLDSASSASLPSSNGTFAFESGTVTFNPSVPGVTGIAVIHTRKSGGKLLVSTQDIFLIQDTNAAWTAPAQLNEAIKSYGESTTVPLAPGGSSDFGSGNDSSTGGDGANGEGSLE